MFSLVVFLVFFQEVSATEYHSRDKAGSTLRFKINDNDKSAPGVGEPNKPKANKPNGDMRGRYPQTGERQGIILPTVGLLLSIASLILWYENKRKKFDNKL